MAKKKSRSLQTSDLHDTRVDRVHGSRGTLSTDSPRVSVQADATIALPIPASAPAATAAGPVGRRKTPTFDLSSRLMTIDGLRPPCDRFEDANEPTV